uniref:Ribonuclease H-like domain-containing protein n=1 Tax=Tanacetum cinerariifolium TaxID=118510 RepID=A0A6L2N441_TANCI|nr:ribonuclease H-like domain-containing protein [Tanacetum cinerariifolium]
MRSNYLRPNNSHRPNNIRLPQLNHLRHKTNPVSVHPMVTRFCVGTNRPTKRLNLHASSVSPLPKYYRDAFSDLNWQNSMRDEYHALIKNKTWTLVPIPPDTNIVHCMWLFHHKYLEDGTLSHYKARLVANGSTQLKRVDVDETFSPVVKPGIIQTVLSLAASRHWPIHQLDVKNKKYAVEVIERENMAHCNPSRTPIDTESKLGSDGDSVSDPTLYRSLAGSLQYLTFTHQDISYVVQQIWLLIKMQNGLVALLLGVRLLVTMYFLATTCSLSPLSVSRRFLVPAQRQNTVVLPMLLLRIIGYTIYCVSCTPLSSDTLVYCDNVSAVYLFCNLVRHQCTKHIEIDIHFVRDLVAADQVRVLHVLSRYQYADIFIKGLHSALFEEFRTSLSVRCPPALTAGEC